MRVYESEILIAKYANQFYLRHLIFTTQNNMKGIWSLNILIIQYNWRYNLANHSIHPSRRESERRLRLGLYKIYWIFLIEFAFSGHSVCRMHYTICATIKNI